MEKPKILIVDDSPVVLEGSAMVLEEAGFEVLTLENPLSVAHLVRKEKPGLLLIDINMPTVNGATVVKILGQQEAVHRTKVALYSDLPEARLRTIAAQCGADGFIQKTMDGAGLADQVRRLLQS
ncbi:MAG: response regulator [Deltaproteobacteria bacterium]|nr:response regulator [Deltaproteobacteria bacterium]